MAKGIINEGDQFNDWTVIRHASYSNGAHHYVCQCVCGTIKEVRKGNLGKVVGCGCSRKKHKNKGVTKNIGRSKSQLVLDDDSKPYGERYKSRTAATDHEHTDAQSSVRRSIEDILDQRRLAAEIHSY